MATEMAVLPPSLKDFARGGLLPPWLSPCADPAERGVVLWLWSRESLGQLRPETKGVREGDPPAALAVNERLCRGLAA